MSASERYDLVKCMYDADVVGFSRLPSLRAPGTFPVGLQYNSLQESLVDCSEVGSPQGE